MEFRDRYKTNKHFFLFVPFITNAYATSQKQKQPIPSEGFCERRLPYTRHKKTAYSGKQ